MKKVFSLVALLSFFSLAATGSSSQNNFQQNRRYSRSAILALRSRPLSNRVLQNVPLDIARYRKIPVKDGVLLLMLLKS